MELRKIIISTLFFIILTANFAFSYDNLGTSARAVGMGNAFVAVADDPSAVFYNPAGLARLKGVHLSMMYDRGSVWGYALDEKPYVGFGSLVYPLSGKSGVLAFSAGRKASWNSWTQIVGQNIISLSYARPIGPMSSLGLNAKLLSNSKVDKKSGFEVDLGLLFPITDRFSLGLAGENLLGTDMTPDSSLIYAPPQTPSLFNYNRRQYKVGLSANLPSGTNSTRIAYDVIVKDKKNFSTSTPYLNSLGVEQGISLIPGSSFFLRAGYTFGKDYNQDYKQWAWGISYKTSTGSNTIQIDYSYQSYPFETSTSLVGDHRLGLTIGFGFAKHPDYFSKNKSQTKFAKQEESKKDKISEVSKEVKPSTIPVSPEKPVSGQTLVKKEEPKVSVPTTPTSTPLTPTVSTPSTTGTKVASTEKPSTKTAVVPSTPTPEKSTTTTGKTQVAATDKSKTTTTPSTVPSSAAKTTTPEKAPVSTVDKSKTTVTTPVTTPSSVAKTTTAGKPVTTEKTKVTPTEKPKPTTVTQTPTTPTASKTAPTPTTTSQSKDKTKAISVTKAPTTTTAETKVTPKGKPVTTTADKSKTTAVTQTPATKSTTPVTPSVQPKTTTVTKAPTTTSTTKVTPTEKPKPTPVGKTPTATTETKVTPTTKPSSVKPTTTEKSVPVTPKVSPTDKSKEITLAQVTPKEEVTPIPALQKTKEIFEPLKVSAKMEKIQTQSVRKKSNSYMFIFKAGLNDDEDAIVDWKVYVCSAMPKSNDWEQISAVLIKTLEGRGNLPSGILWDASPETQMLPSVYYALQIKTAMGKKYFTAWQTGKMVK